MIKILQFELTNNIGGIETFLLNIYKNCDRKSYQFDFITTYENTAYKREIENLGGHIFKIPSYKTVFAYANAINKIVKQNDYDVIHIHKNSAANIISALIAKKSSKAKIIVHSHNTLPTRGATISVLLHKLNRNKLYRLADIHLACSDIAGKWMFGNKEYKLIPNGVNANHFQFSEEGRSIIRQEFAIPKNAFVVGNVGRFVEQKNHKFLVDIFEKIQKKRESSYLILVGTGELEAEIRKQVNEKKIADHVIFTGTRNDVSNIMSAMDVFVMTSLYEGLPIVAVEAQTNGLKVLLANTIAEEADIFGDVEWFSLNNIPENIAEQIVQARQRTAEERHTFKNRLDVSDYSLNHTVKLIENIYECNV